MLITYRAKIKNTGTLVLHNRTITIVDKISDSTKCIRHSGDFTDTILLIDKDINIIYLEGQNGNTTDVKIAIPLPDTVTSTHMSGDALIEVIDYPFCTGTLTRITFSNAVSLIKVPDYLPSSITDTSYMFENCKLFNDIAISSWDMKNIVDTFSMFDNAKLFNQNLNSWNISNVSNMSSMFCDCISFNQPLDRWDTEIVEMMRGMFAGCTSFNQNIDNWKVGNVHDMHAMFADCVNFNQPLNSWNVRSVTEMDSMFLFCKVFNRPLDNWVICSLKNMCSMFYGCDSFEQDISMWDLSSVNPWNGGPNLAP